MISNPERTTAISSMGWVDHDAAWQYDSASGKAKRLLFPENSGAQFLSLHNSGLKYFSIAHHFSGKRFDISVRSHSQPSEALACASVTEEGTKISGDGSIWQYVPQLYVAYLGFEPWQDFVLITVRPNSDVVAQRLEWYDGTYDKGYQGVVDVLELPGRNAALVSVQRSSKLVVHDLENGRQIQTIDLGGRLGNPELRFRGRTEIWASDYDTLVVLDERNLRVLKSARLQNSADKSQQFIGDYSFSLDEKTCYVARPFSGDVIAIDAETMSPKLIAKTGRQPLQAAGLADGSVIARDWQTGDSLPGRLEQY
jgi:hypothetical protein